MKEWTESNKQFDEFVNVGDFVGEDIIDYFADDVPPLLSTDNILMCGEAYDIQDGETTHATFALLSIGSWVFLGYKSFNSINKIR